MLLFTKESCNKCEFLKTKIDLESLDIKEMKLTADDAHVLAEAAFFEIVELAEKELPILITNNNGPVAGAVNILRHLKENKYDY